MKITILGSGTASINNKKHEAAYLIEHNRKLLLFDSGAGTVYQLSKLGMDIKKLDALFYTHFHNDHINDLPAILWANNSNPPRKNDLTIYGPDGLNEYVKILTEKIMKKQIQKFKYPIKIFEKSNQTFDTYGLKIKTQKLNHFDNIAYRIELNGKVFVYTGDSDYCKELVDIISDADLCIMECATIEGSDHLNPSKCARAAKEGRVKKLVLTHSYPELDDVDVIGIVKKEFKGKVVLAKDFMKLTL